METIFHFQNIGESNAIRSSSRETIPSPNIVGGYIRENRDTFLLTGNLFFLNRYCTSLKYSIRNDFK